MKKNHIDSFLDDNQYKESLASNNSSLSTQFLNDSLYIGSSYVAQGSGGSYSFKDLK